MKPQRRQPLSVCLPGAATRGCCKSARCAFQPSLSANQHQYTAFQRLWRRAEVGSGTRVSQVSTTPLVWWLSGAVSSCPLLFCERSREFQRIWSECGRTMRTIARPNLLYANWHEAQVPKMAGWLAMDHILVTVFSKRALQAGKPHFHGEGVLSMRLGRMTDKTKR